MNATCQQCDTVFRIDPAKVPGGRVRVRCSICRAVFEIRDSGDGADGAGAPTSDAAPEQAGAPGTGTGPAREGSSPEAAGDTLDRRPPEVAPKATPRAEPERRSAPAPTAPAPQGAGPAKATRPAPSFGSKDPDARARRLARALVSDMATYHPDRRDRALQAGNLKDEFREEIKKSWQEYVEQVGLQAARGTPHFRDALNDILAKGNRIF